MSTPASICTALNDAVLSDFTHYAPAYGDQDLRSVLAGLISSASGRSYGSQQVIVTHGASAALSSVVMAAVEPGERVILPQPTYPLFFNAVRLAGAQAIAVGQLPDFHLDIDRIEDAARSARMIIICNPCNPTGVIYTRDELHNLGIIASRYGLLVAVDEAYHRIVFDGQEFTSALSVPSLADQLVYIQTFSKTYAMCGWRIGYLAAPPELAEATGAVHRAINGPVNSAVQRAALTALNHPDEWVNDMRSRYQGHRDLVVNMVRGSPLLQLSPPQATFYAFIKYASEVPSTRMVEVGLRAGVAVRPGTEYGTGGEGYLRIAYSADRHTVAAGMTRLVRLFADLGRPTTTR